MATMQDDNWLDDFQLHSEKLEVRGRRIPPARRWELRWGLSELSRITHTMHFTAERWDDRMDAFLDSFLAGAKACDLVDEYLRADEAEVKARMRDALLAAGRRLAANG